MSIQIRGEETPHDEVRETTSSALPTDPDTHDPLGAAAAEHFDQTPIPEEQLEEIKQRAHPFL